MIIFLVHLGETAFVDQQLELLQGTLHQSWTASAWGESENNRKAKYYRLTAAGKRWLQSETEKWNRMAEVIAGILHTTPEEV